MTRHEHLSSTKQNNVPDRCGVSVGVGPGARTAVSGSGLWLWRYAAYAMRMLN
jgi:hypothetical protein